MKTNRMAMSTAAGLAALALGLAGCGGSDSGNEADEAQSSPAASESAPADTADDDQTEDTDDKDDQADDANDSTQAASGSGLSAEADLSRESPATSAEDAIKTAKKKAGNGIVHGIELDWDDDDQAWQYEVSVLDGNTDHDIEIDADSGKIVNEDQDDSDDKEKAIDLNDPMTFDEALELAAEEGSGKLVSWKLEYDDDKQEYQFDFDKDGEETEVTVDTDTKRVSVDD